VSGTVTVTGRATSQRFRSYRLEYGAGESPSSYTRISGGDEEEDSGTLARWNTSGLEEGVYTLRLVVEDRSRGPISASVTVRIGAPAGPTPGPTGTPPRRP
jgi:hypothetical protein